MAKNSPKKAKIEDVRHAAKIVSAILRELQGMTVAGVDLDLMDELAARRIEEAGATSFNKGYHPKWSAIPYPSTLCTSVNAEVCHGTPRGRILKEGDIVTYDLGIRYKTGCGDAALTVAVGEVANREERLLRYAKRALEAGLSQVKAGAKVSEVGNAIQKLAVIHGYNVIREFGGHAIGTEMHEEPHIPNHWNAAIKDVFVEGQVVCIEPMITPGSGQTSIDSADKWTVFCVDGKPCAMFEAMALVTKDGCEVLTDHIEL